MKVTIGNETFDPEEGNILDYAEENDLCHFPKGQRFQSVLLCEYNGHFYLHGTGYWGCHTIIPVTENEKNWWIQHNKMSKANE